MALSRPVLACCVAAILLMCLGTSWGEAPPCTTVVTELLPCMSYLKDGKKDPSQACCTGVKDMAGKATSKPDRTKICECIKKALSSADYNPSLIPTLPKKCGVSINLPPIDHNTDCAKAMNPSLLA